LKGSFIVGTVLASGNNSVSSEEKAKCTRASTDPIFCGDIDRRVGWEASGICDVVSWMGTLVSVISDSVKFFIGTSSVNYGDSEVVVVGITFFTSTWFDVGKGFIWLGSMGE